MIAHADWDALIILDACRFDYFKKHNWINGVLHKVELKSSCTPEFLEAYFPDHYDITYVSANPFVNSKIKLWGYEASTHFSKIIDVWDFGWDDSIQTVHPSTVTKAALQYVDERMIIHYMQPHHPYIGVTRFNAPPSIFHPNTVKNGVLKPPKSEHYSEEQVKAWRLAYRDNLLLALKEVDKLVQHIKGKIVVSADHGELLGEDGLTYHPCKVDYKHPLLNTVPWLEVDEEL